MACSEFDEPDVCARAATAEARRRAHRSTCSQRPPTATAGAYYTPLKTPPSSDDEHDAQVNMLAHVHHVAARRTQLFGLIFSPSVSPQM